MNYLFRRKCRIRGRNLVHTDCGKDNDHAAGIGKAVNHQMCENVASSRAKGREKGAMVKGWVFFTLKNTKSP